VSIRFSQLCLPMHCSCCPACTVLSMWWRTYAYNKHSHSKHRITYITIQYMQILRISVSSMCIYWAKWACTLLYYSISKFSILSILYSQKNNPNNNAPNTAYSWYALASRGLSTILIVCRLDSLLCFRAFSFGCILNT
jgi:hypothetical protein